MIEEFVSRLDAGGALTGVEASALARDRFGSELLGLVWDEASLHDVRAHLDADQRHHQPMGIVHGGVWCSVIESAASLGAALHGARDGKVLVGVSNSTDFLRQHRTGRIDAVAEPIHVGRTQHLWQVHLCRATDGKVVARGQVRMQALVVEAR
ncbi:PaaI family thioesterase [Nitriliruptoraceae bacterium ZYF776]|nr:PaaI family thioesterase [Profundirhabdus halotolerans]